MSILNKIAKSVPTCPRLTIYGKPGIGKSTLASQFPDPLFLLTEQSGLVGFDSISPPDSFTEMWDNVKGLLAEPELPYKTIVIDSISKLDALVVSHLLDKEPKKVTSLAAACGGYGAGYLAAQQCHRAFKGLMDRFQGKDIAVVYIAHIAVSSIKPPDNDDYTIYTIVMNHDKSREVYIDDVDGVLLCKQKEMVITADSGRNLVKSSNERILVTGANATHVSKNRYALPNEIPMSFEELAKYIPFYQQGVKQ